jgi:hypothetical protein
MQAVEEEIHQAQLLEAPVVTVVADMAGHS